MRTSKGNRKVRDSLATLKAWVHWVNLNPVSEDQAELAAAVNDVISQVGTWKAKYEQLRGAQMPRVQSGRHRYSEPRQPGCTCTASWSARNASQECQCGYNGNGTWRCPHGNIVPGHVAQDDTDPTRWCNACGALTREKCHCGPIAENE